MSQSPHMPYVAPFRDEIRQPATVARLILRRGRNVIDYDITSADGRMTVADLISYLGYLADAPQPPPGTPKTPN